MKKWLVIFACAAGLAFYFLLLPRWKDVEMKRLYESGDLVAFSDFATKNRAAARRMLAIAFQDRDKELFSQLLDAGTNPNRIFVGRLMLIHEAAAEPDAFWLVRLLEAGADPNENQVVNDICPISEAIEAHQSENVKMLLSHGASPNARTKRSSSMLIKAWAMGRYEIAFELLTNGADYNRRIKKTSNFIYGLKTKPETDPFFIERDGERGLREQEFRRKIEQWFVDQNLDVENAVWQEGSDGTGIWEIPPLRDENE